MWRTFLLVLVCASVSLAGATTQPATQPAAKFPTPAELLEKIRQMKQEQQKLLKVAYFELSSPIVERPADFSFFVDQAAQTLRSLLDRIEEARDDKDVRAVLLTLGSDMSLSLAQAQELRDALSDVRRVGKRVFVYADAYETVGYTIACAATDVCMMEGGQILIPGVGIEATFAKGLLDKIGVKADYVQIGEYKGADEQFTRTAPSDELRGELNKLMDALYEQIVDGISLHRNLPRDTVRQMVDEAMVSAPSAADRGLVDHLVEMDDLRELIADELGDEIDLVHDYGQQKEELDLSNPFALLALLARKPAESDKPLVALIHADGVIVDGEGSESLFGGGAVGSDDLREAFRVALRDEQVRAVVLRVDSPGGSALASEAIWQAARRLAEDKPLIVSIGSTAASGGYYIASAGEHIFADPAALIGSIGVVGGKFVTKDLYDKIGLATESFRRGKNADLFSSTQPFDERQRRMITNWMRRTYDQFTERVLSVRGQKIKDIDQVARGRIFLARQAAELGMVDQLGGLREAIAHAAQKAELSPGEFDVKVLPAPKTLADLFSGAQDVKAPLIPRTADSPLIMLQALPPDARRAIVQQLQILHLLQRSPVTLVTPYTLRLR